MCKIDALTRRTELEALRVQVTLGGVESEDARPLPEPVGTHCAYPSIFQYMVTDSLQTNRACKYFQ